jgi:hypothetical protein
VSGSYAGRQIVGIDLHRRRSVLVRMTEAGETLETVRISNDPEYLRAMMARAGEAPEVGVGGDRTSSPSSALAMSTQTGSTVTEVSGPIWWLPSGLVQGRLAASSGYLQKMQVGFRSISVRRSSTRCEGVSRS